MKSVGLPPNTTTYNALLRVLMTKGDIGQMLKRYADMKSVNIPPDDITFVILLQGLAKKDEPQPLLDVSSFTSQKRIL